VFLASDRLRFVTGSEFVLDAGLLTRCSRKGRSF
jgi:hypothetical protein